MPLQEQSTPIAHSSSLQSLQVPLPEFVAVCSPLHCRTSGHSVAHGTNGGGMAGTPKGCCEPTHLKQISFGSVDMEQMWLCLDGARIPALCWSIPGKGGGKSRGQDSGCAKLLWGISKQTHKRFAPRQCLRCSTREAAGLPRVPTMCTTPLFCVLSFRPGSLEQNTKLNGWNKTHLKIFKRKPVQFPS